MRLRASDHRPNSPSIKFSQGWLPARARHNAAQGLRKKNWMNKNTPSNDAQSVERRLHTRHRARTSVYITIPGGRKKLCRAVNLSATGVFIQTTDLGLRKGQQVDLSFAINLGSVTKIHRRTAVVAHVSRGGTGLMMEAYGAR